MLVENFMLENVIAGANVYWLVRRLERLLKKRLLLLNDTDPHREAELLSIKKIGHFAGICI